MFYKVVISRRAGQNAALEDPHGRPVTTMLMLFLQFSLPGEPSTQPQVAAMMQLLFTDKTFTHIWINKRTIKQKQNQDVTWRVAARWQSAFEDRN